MRIAVISDIHANLAAFEAILNDIVSQNVSEIICLGDIIGYGPDPEEVVSEIRKCNILTIQGNHEYGLTYRPYFNRMNEDPRRSLELNLKMLSDESISYINNLEPIVIHNNIRLVHGCPPKSQTAYLFFPTQKMLDKIFGSFSENICFYGHTHTLNFFEEGLPVEKGLDIELGSYRLHPSRRYIINPGSVGQPRDGINNLAKYLIWDQEKHIVTYRAVNYDIMQTINKLRQLKFPRFNAERLIL